MNIKTIFMLLLLGIGTFTIACRSTNDVRKSVVKSDTTTQEITQTDNEASVSNWEPEKKIEFIIMAGKGGGADKMARFIQKIIEDNKLSSQQFVPINKPNNSGAEALQYLQNLEDKNHTVLVTLNSFYTTPLRKPELGIDIYSFTPIARMAEDSFVLWVHKDSGINNLEEFVKAAKTTGEKWQMAGTGKGQEDQIITNFLNSSYDLNISYLPFKGGGAVAKQLANKQVNSTVNNPSEALSFYEKGIFTPLAVFTAERLARFPDTPNFQEKGQDFDYDMQRSIVGPPGMSKEAEIYYRNLFKKVYESSEWQKYMNDKSLKGNIIFGDYLKSYWKFQEEKHKQLLKKAGEIK
ncbi:tripartite tricarboxylate transporter substrate-binding protein [Mastigocoleus sp. MO_188.B34]|uniref:Bug family tripartite tricarboxylate transporter substrate binding protein n=1 Tax=Mastigocoleus sp. MO_188.B34 TaxID=3036635 RepID=UPI00262E832C|nr:tripartite tricarboxylate transporter substrate-binding protein [Mastigocoleus sp. MO_188.B34]MDJ0697229.1 tripartite tricarboxylate transporter substrate-binding protein [Mastigocoleus sp. MO_188.B34]